MPDKIDMIPILRIPLDICLKNGGYPNAPSINIIPIDIKTRTAVNSSEMTIKNEWMNERINKAIKRRNVSKQFINHDFFSSNFDGEVKY